MSLREHSWHSTGRHRHVESIVLRKIKYLNELRGVSLTSTTRYILLNDQTLIKVFTKRILEGEAECLEEKIITMESDVVDSDQSFLSGEMTPTRTRSYLRRSNFSET